MGLAEHFLGPWPVLAVWGFRRNQVISLYSFPGIYHIL